MIAYFMSNFGIYEKKIGIFLYFNYCLFRKVPTEGKKHILY